MSSFQVQAIGHVSSPFKEKFGIPRQPQICSVESKIWLTGDANTQDSIRGLELYSHIWVLFQFHQNEDKGWQPLVRPPRMDGNKKLGVFATRSTFRPNQIGMSAVKVINCGTTNGDTWITVAGLDLVDGTPIIDIKPYVPYSDCLPEASSKFAHEPQKTEITIEFSQSARAVIQLHKTQLPALEQTISQVLQQDPRPAYKKSKVDDKIYGIRLYDFNIRWKITENTCEVLEIEQEL